MDCTPFCEACELDDAKATAKGRVVYDVLYETDYKSRLRCCSFTQEFSQSVPISKSDKQPINAFCNITCERINCKLLSPRRIVIKTTLGTQFEIEGISSLKALAVNEDTDTFFRKKEVHCEGQTELYEEAYHFSESFPLSQNEKCIGEIVCGSISLQRPQVTVSNGQADIKTIASIHTLCEEENNEGRYYMSVKTMPINIEYQNSAIDADKRLSVTLEPSGAEFSQELDQYGENRIIKMEFSVKMKLKASCETEYALATDMFEKEFDGVNIVSTASFPTLFSKTDIGFSEEMKTEPLMPLPVNILDTTVVCRGTSVEKTESGVFANGVFSVTMLYESEEGIQSADRVIQFEREFALDLPEAEPDIVAETYPIEVQSTLHSDGSVSLRVVASTNIAVYAENEESFISDVAKRTSIEADDESCSMIYCFPKEGEDIWDIAKYYRACPDTILDMNRSLFDENRKAIAQGKPILIKC